MANYFTVAGEGGAGAGSGSYVGLGDYPRLSQMLQQQQQMANLGRIPGAAGLESQSTEDIASLLNPPALFPDTSRIAAETAAGRGVAGSGAGYSTAVRMTDEERLKRMALGQQMLGQAYGRNPAAPPIDPLRLGITPYQQQELALRRLGVTGGPAGVRPPGGIGHYGGGMPHLGATHPLKPPVVHPDDTPWIPPWVGGDLSPVSDVSVPDAMTPSPDLESLLWDLYNLKGISEDPSSWMDYNDTPIEGYPGSDSTPYEMPQYPPWQPPPDEGDEWMV